MIRTRFVLPFWPLNADSANQGATSLTPIAAALAAGLFSLTPIAATAATIQVGVSGCTLANAIRNANSIFDADGSSGCALGSLLGTDTITLPASSTQVLQTVLPSITSVITIMGNGATVRRNPRGPDFRILTVTALGNLTLNDTTVSGGRARKVGAFDTGRGGGILSAGVLKLNNSAVSGNSADLGGGGVSMISGATTLTNSFVSNNYAGYGGGVYASRGSMKLNTAT